LSGGEDEVAVLKRATRRVWLLGLVLGLVLGGWFVRAPPTAAAPSPAPALASPCPAPAAARPPVGAAPARSPLPAPSTAGHTLAISQDVRDGTRGQGNPMFLKERPPLDVRERLFFAVLSCVGVVYLLVWLTRQVLPGADLAAPAALPATLPASTPAVPGADPAAPGPAPPAPPPRPVPAADADAASPLLRLLSRLGPGHILAFYLGVAVTVTFPAVLRLGTCAIGDNASDVWKHLWGWWWVKDALLHHGVLPLFSADINAPFGGSLYCIDPLNALLSVPLQLVLPLPAVFNLIVWLQLTAGAFAAWWLVRDLTGSAAAAIPAGLLYGFSPYVMAYPVTSGVTETVNLCWVPLSVLFWLRTVRDPAGRSPFYLALCVFGCFFGSFYYGAFLLLLLGTLAVGGTLGWLIGLMRRPRTSGAAAWPAARAVASRLAGALAVAGLLVALPVAAFFYTVAQPDSIIPHYVQDREQVSSPYMALASQNYAPLASYLAMGKANLTSTFTTDRLSRSAYVGYIVLFWVVVGLFSGGWTRPAAGLAAFFVLLSMGPWMVVTPTVHLSAPVSPVYLLCYRVVPLFARIAIPYRLVLLVTLFLGVVMAGGLRRVLAGQTRWMQHLMALVVSLQILAEFAVASPAPYPVPLAPARVPAFYRGLPPVAAGTEAILDLPVTRWNTELTPGEYFLYQTVHHRPIPYTISGTFYQSLLGNRFTALLCRPHFVGPAGVPVPGPAAARAWLTAHHFRYVVVHRDLMLPDDVATLETLLDGRLGAAAPAVDGLRIYDIETLSKARL